MSKVDREELISTELLDQERHLLLKSLSEINNIDLCEYLIKLVNGNLIVSINEHTDAFSVQSVFKMVKESVKEQRNCKLCL